jgi:tRNA modification GTPase
MSDFDTAPIAAIATAPGRGGIGVIRVSGPTLERLVLCLFNQALIPRYAHYLPFNDVEGNVIDMGLAILFKGPQSYTGEDVLELQGHGGSAVLNRLLTRVLEAGQSDGVRLAQPGEFSLRAFLNNKIDLAQAEAVADLVDATSAAAAKAAIGSLTGQFSIKIKQVTQSIVQLRTLVEATLDFPEEEIEFIEQYQVKEKLNDIEIYVQTLLTTSRSSLALKDGLRVVLVGEPNVGKSSLLNALCGESIAIVTDIAGTTRDRIAQDLNIDGVPITLVDTAGLRDTADQIEILGIERTWQEISQADVLLHVVDVSSQYKTSIETKIETNIEISTKSDTKTNTKPGTKVDTESDTESDTKADTKANINYGLKNIPIEENLYINKATVEDKLQLNQYVTNNNEHQRWLKLNRSQPYLLNLTLINKCDLMTQQQLLDLDNLSTDHVTHVEGRRKHQSNVCDKNNDNIHNDNTHNDIHNQNHNNFIYVSAKTGQGLDILKSKLLAAAGRTVGESSPWQGRTRHIHALEITLNHLTQAQNHLSFNGVELDIVAEELRLAHHAIGEITGKFYADELLGEIFSNFCIGK